MRAIAIALVVGACYSPTPPAGAPCGEGDVCPSGQSCINGLCGGGGSGSADADVPIDMNLADAPDTCATWNAEHFDACAIPAPMGDLNLTTALSGFSFDTSSGSLKGKMNTTIDVTTMVLTQIGGPDVMLMSVNNFTLEAGATLDINGTRPLLIAAWGTATIAGDIDVTATLTAAGPGGFGALTDPYCTSAPTGNFGASGTPSTGAGGGAFQGNGGQGGNTGGAQGTSIGVPAIIRGGCAGGGGGAGTGGTGSTRGAGGGAVQITARTSITVTADGTINAGGGGGGFGRVAYGGGGAGGSGGYIGLDSPIVNVAGVLAANGGSGGGGASDVAQDGNSGLTGAAGNTAVLGGIGAATTNVGTCPRGGSGSAGGSLNGSIGGSSACGGSGAGGGAGYILIWSPGTNVTGTVSPPALAGP